MPHFKTFIPNKWVPARPPLPAAARSPLNKRSFLRGILDRQTGQVTPVSGQASHQLASLAKANALIVVPETVTALAAGDQVHVLELPTMGVDL